MANEPSNRLEELIRERARLDAELERHQQLLTILFVDIVGSTRFYDQHGDLAGLVMVQKVLDTLTPIIEQHDGVVAKTIGDAILAWFRNAQTAVRCGIAMQRALDARNHNRPPNDKIHIRVSLNLGLGLLKEKDVFGDVVNVASRIEKATESDEIAISPSVYEQVQHVPDIHVRRKASGVEFKGKAEKLDLYSVIWREGETPPPAPPRPSSEQLALATGLHAGLEKLARRETPRPEAPPEEKPRARGKAPRAAPAEPRPAPPSRVGKGTVVMGMEEAEKPAAAGMQFFLTLVRGDGSLGERYPVDKPGLILGRDRGEIQFPADAQLAPEHARFTQLGDALYVEDVSGGPGVFRRLRAAQILQPGDVVMLGRQKFCFQMAAGGATAAPEASPKKTQMFGMQAAAAAPPQLEQLSADDQVVKRLPLSDPETTFGRSRGTHTFPDDRYMSGQHARLFRGPEGFLLEDQNSTNGSYLRIRKRALVKDGDIVLVGGQLLKVVLETQ